MSHSVKKITSLLLSVIMLSAVIFCIPTASAADTYTAQSAILKVAVNELGYAESGIDNTKYGEWFGAQTAWCCIFISWCANETDLRFGTNMYGNIFPKTGTCTNSMQWFQRRGEFQSRSSGYVPKAGDLIYFNWNGGSNAQHIGIVEGTSTKNGVTNVDQLSGNFGNAVKRYSYKLSDTRILGYATPNYASQGSGLVDNGNGWTSNEKDPDDGIITFSGSGTTTDNLNVRKGPSTGYSKLGTVPKGSSVAIIGKFSNGWYKINYGSGVGYVCGDYVKLNDSPVTTTAASTTTTTNINNSNVTDMNAIGQTTDNLNVRTGPATSYKILGTAPKGSDLTVTGKVSGSPDWYRVNYKGNIGYVCGTYLKLSSTPNTTTITTMKPTTTTTTQVTTTTQTNEENLNGSGTTTANLNMRTGPSTSYSRILVIPSGTQVQITDKTIIGSTTWYKIIYKDYTGYVSGDYLSNLKFSDNNTETLVGKTGITTDYLNVRTGPGTSYSKLAVLSKGTKVNILNETNGWYHIAYNTGSAYVCADYVK